mmetsp:Transcript_91887/g.230970  ORF Transcript_91887/g.230970 Transcript_91887/m.230970 type:complete len:212 (-) Transcript_91887:1116-1751(-)
MSRTASLQPMASAESSSSTKASPRASYELRDVVAWPNFELEAGMEFRPFRAWALTVPILPSPRCTGLPPRSPATSLLQSFMGSRPNFEVTSQATWALASPIFELEAGMEFLPFVTWGSTVPILPSPSCTDLPPRSTTSSLLQSFVESWPSFEVASQATWAFASTTEPIAAPSAGMEFLSLVTWVLTSIFLSPCKWPTTCCTDIPLRSTASS